MNASRLVSRATRITVSVSTARTLRGQAKEDTSWSTMLSRWRTSSSNSRSKQGYLVSNRTRLGLKWGIRLYKRRLGTSQTFMEGEVIKIKFTTGNSKCICLMGYLVSLYLLLQWNQLISTHCKNSAQIFLDMILTLNFVKCLPLTKFQPITTPLSHKILPTSPKTRFLSPILSQNLKLASESPNFVPNLSPKI